MKGSAVQFEHLYSDSTSNTQSPSIEDILKFQDATAALKQLQEILGESKLDFDSGRDRDPELSSLVSDSTHFGQSSESFFSTRNPSHDEIRSSSARSFLAMHEQPLIQRRHSANDQYRLQHQCFLDPSDDHHFNMDIGLNDEIYYETHSARPAISRDLSFQEETTFLACQHNSSNHIYHDATGTLQRKSEGHPQQGYSSLSRQGPSASVSDTFKEFEFVFFDAQLKDPSTSPDSPTANSSTPPSGQSAGQILTVGSSKSSSASRFDQAPPTPGLTLVEQLRMDRRLMEAIVKKHKRGYYKCTHCPRTFSNIFEYAGHMDTFDIKREYKCPFDLCPWKILGLPRRADLRRHCAIQHKHELPQDLKEQLNLNDEAYPALKCPHLYCDKVFHRRDAYNRHIAIVHDKLNSRFNKRLFQTLADCPYEQEDDRQRYVNMKMKSKKQQQQQLQQQYSNSTKRELSHSSQKP